MREHIGGIYDWLAGRDREDGTPSTPRGGVSSALPNEAKASELSSGALDYQRQKEEAKARRAVERELKQAEERSAAIDDELRALEEKLAQPEHATDTELFTQYSQLKQEQEALLVRWEELALQLEA